MRDLLKQARKENKAIGAFSISSTDMILGIISAAEEAGRPVILQIAECRLSTSPLEVIGPAMVAAAKYAKVPVAVHLDHGLTLETVEKALKIGFTSVMIDGSQLSLEENIALTSKVIEMAKPYGAAVEAEIGRVGRTESGEDAPALCASPEDALRFVESAPVDALAVAIGNAHGVYIGTPDLRFDVLEALEGKGMPPMVLHGGTGISDDDFRRCIGLGMNKINIATATFQAVNAAAPGEGGYFAMAQRMQSAAKEVAEKHIRIFNNEGGNPQ